MVIVNVKKQNKMKKFWEVVNLIFDWIMNIIITVILIGGSAYIIKDLLS